MVRVVPATILAGTLIAAGPMTDPSLNHDARLSLARDQDSASGEPLLIIRPPGTAGQRIMFRGFPMIVGLHPDGSTPERLKAPFEHLAQQVRVVAVLPQAKLPAGGGFKWGSVEDAEPLVLRAVDTTRQRAQVARGQVVLVGFSETATLACALALRHPEQWSGVVAVGPALEAASPVGPPNPQNPVAFAILCTEGDPSAERCQATVRLLKDLGYWVDSRVLTARQAGAGLDRLKEALNSLLRGLPMPRTR